MPDTKVSALISNTKLNKDDLFYIVDSSGPIERSIKAQYIQNVYNVKQYGATGNGITDDRPAIQSAIDAAGLAGGGIVYIPPGTYLLNEITSTSSLDWHLSLSYSNIILQGDGPCSILKTDRLNADIINIGPSGMYVNYPEYSIFDVDTGLYEMTTALRGSNSVTLAVPGEASNFVADDYIFIRTGQLLSAYDVFNPDAEINQVVSANIVTGEIVLRYPLSRSYYQEYYIAGASGLTSTTPTANPAPFGVKNINNKIIKYVAVRDMRLESTSGTHGIIGGQLVGLEIINIQGIFTGGGLQSMGSYRDAIIQNNQIYMKNAGNYDYTLSTATGTSNVIFCNNRISSTGESYIHIHEGSSQINIFNNVILNTPSSSDHPSISVRARAYDIQIHNNSLVNGGNTCGIYIDETCSGGGIVDGNQFQGSNWIDPIAISANNWTVGINQYIDGNHGIALYESDYGNIERLVAYVGHDAGNTNGKQTPVMGVLPNYNYVLRVHVQVIEAFNSAGSDVIYVGRNAVWEAYAQPVDVSTTGIKTVVLGTEVGYNLVGTEVIARYYTDGGIPTQGKAVVILEYSRVPTII